jgi:hypothetical protein
MIIRDGKAGKEEDSAKSLFNFAYQITVEVFLHDLKLKLLQRW